MSSRRPWGAIAALVVIGVAATGWAVVASPVFDVREVRVDGNHHLGAAEVVRLADLDAGASLLTVPSERLERTLARHPWIRTAKVTRSFPSTLILTIHERSPVAWVRDPDGAAVIAADGIVLGHRPRAPRGLVAIGRSERVLRRGSPLDGLEDRLVVAASFGPELRGTVRQVSVRRGEVLLRLEDDTRVLYGGPGSLGQKNAALTKVLRWAAGQGTELDYVDLRAATNPAVKVRS